MNPLRWPRPGSGPAVARLFQRLLGATFLTAFASLGWQVHALVGSRGLMPAARFLDAVRAQGLGGPWSRMPTLFWFGASDGALTAGIGVGLLLSALAILGVRPRLCFALLTPLYLSFAVACRTFLSFQWDNLLIECGFLAAFLSADRPAPVAHFLFRALAFKLYFESGIAKFQSHLHDWHDGSAMTYYYETAPLPTWVSWTFHNLPAFWHQVESRATLALELAVPFAIFGPRRARLLAAGFLTAFQLLDIATANYGFFCYLAAALHVFMLDDADVERAVTFLKRRLRRRQDVAEPAARAVDPTAAEANRAIGRRLRRVGAIAGVTAWVGASLVEADHHFSEPGALVRRLDPVLERIQSLRVVNTYHLFAAITRERIEPQFLTLEAGAWTERHLRHKAGDPKRAPGFVAPHQPRLDFQLWFYGLDFRRREPEYVAGLVAGLCRDPTAVQTFFREPLPERPEAVRLDYWRYQFTSRPERAASGAWWKRTLISSTDSILCQRFRP